MSEGELAGAVYALVQVNPSGDVRMLFGHWVSRKRPSP
jgi:hypothetical protein